MGAPRKADYVAICVSPVIFARIGCALEFRSCRYFGSPGAHAVAWVRLGRQILLLFACPRCCGSRLGAPLDPDSGPLWAALASSIFTFWQPFNFCIIFFIKTYRFSLFWASVCVGLLAGRLAWLAGWPAGWVIAWKSDPNAILVAAVLSTSLGCAWEGGFCAQARVSGDLGAYWVRLGIQIPSLFW